MPNIFLDHNVIKIQLLVERLKNDIITGLFYILLKYLYVFIGKIEGVDIFEALTDEQMSRDEYLDIVVRSVIIEKIYSAREKLKHDQLFHIKTLVLFLGVIMIIKFMLYFVI